MATSNPKVRASDPLLSFQYSFEGTVPGGIQIVGYFTEITGMDADNEVIEYRAVDWKGKYHYATLPGYGGHATIVLKKGVTTNNGFWEWRALVDGGELNKARINATIKMYDRNYQLAAQWDLNTTWPSKISGPELNAGSSDIAVEELTLIVDGFSRVDPTALLPEQT